MSDINVRPPKEAVRSLEAPSCGGQGGEERVWRFCFGGWLYVGAEAPTP
jgi:hypothetical protein